MTYYQSLNSIVHIEDRGVTEETFTDMIAQSLEGFVGYSSDGRSLPVVPGQYTKHMFIYSFTHSNSLDMCLFGHFGHVLIWTLWTCACLDTFHI